jgi:hypothetical protein
MLASSLFSSMEGDIIDRVEMGSGAIQVGDSEVRVSRYRRKYTKYYY